MAKEGGDEKEKVSGYKEQAYFYALSNRTQLLFSQRVLKVRSPPVNVASSPLRWASQEGGSPYKMGPRTSCKQTSLHGKAEVFIPFIILSGTFFFQDDGKTAFVVALTLSLAVALPGRPSQYYQSPTKGSGSGGAPLVLGGGGGLGGSGSVGGAGHVHSSSTGVVGGAGSLGSVGVGGVGGVDHLGGAGVFAGGAGLAGGVGSHGTAGAVGGFDHIGGTGVAGGAESLHAAGSGVGGAGSFGGAGVVGGVDHLGVGSVGSTSGLGHLGGAGGSLGGAGIVGGVDHVGVGSVGVGSVGVGSVGGAGGVNHLGGAGGVSVDHGVDAGFLGSTGAVGGTGIVGGGSVGAVGGVSTDYNPDHYPDIVPGFPFQTSYPGKGFGGCANWCRSSVQKNYYCCTRTSYKG
ncbi:uncharacterized protein [Palaemon carinicauda]|uniref:uncharacterized protein n=1 Tax=Palaemon carinicauda TaxID=392227 RepID=UPI0035B69096